MVATVEAKKPTAKKTTAKKTTAKKTSNRPVLKIKTSDLINRTRMESIAQGAAVQTEEAIVPKGIETQSPVQEPAPIVKPVLVTEPEATKETATVAEPVVTEPEATKEPETVAEPIVTETEATKEPATVAEPVVTTEPEIVAKVVTPAKTPSKAASASLDTLEVDVNDPKSIAKYIKSQKKVKRTDKKPKNFHVSSGENSALRFLQESFADELDLENFSEQKAFVQFMVKPMLVEAIKRGFRFEE